MGENRVRPPCLPEKHMLSRAFIYILFLCVSGQIPGLGPPRGDRTEAFSRGFLCFQKLAARCLVSREKAPAVAEDLLG